MPKDFENTTLDEAEESNTALLYRAALGPINVDYYLPRFEQMDVAERWRPSWNWGAALSGVNWMVFRQLWGAALVYVGVCLTLALLLFGVGRLVLHFSDTTEMGLTAGLVLLASVVPGLLGNHLLYHASRKRVERALADHPEVPEACAALEKKAPSKSRFIAQASANVVALGLALAGYMMLPGRDEDLSSPWAAASGASAAAGGQVGHPTEKHHEAAGKTVEVDAATSRTASDASAPVSQDLAPAPPLAAASAAAATSAPPLQATVSAATHASADSALGSARASAGPVTTANNATATEPTANTAHHTASSEHDAAPSVRPTHTAPAPTAAAHASPHTAPSDSKKTSQSRKPGATSASATASHVQSSGARYGINVGLFADENNAQNAYAKLVHAALPATQETLQTSKGRRVRVRVGPLANETEANTVVEKIRALGLDALIYTIPPSTKH